MEEDDDLSEKEGKETPILDEDDAESEEEQTWKDEYEDKEGESTAPSHHGPGITIIRYRCKTCGHTVERPVTGTAYDEMPPTHHQKEMIQVSEEEAKLPLEEFLEMAKLKRDKKAAAKQAKAVTGAVKKGKKR